MSSDFVQPRGSHLAQLNVGRLVADPGDPRVAPFLEAIERVNAVGKRARGFVWMMEGSGEPGAGPGNTDLHLDGDPRAIANLTVWQDVASLEAFVWQSVHRRFYERRTEWFRTLAESHLVFWWVPEGHRPDMEEALDRLDLLRRVGPTPEAFGWAEILHATLWREGRCTPA
jgi:hypothetical protein